MPTDADARVTLWMTEDLKTRVEDRYLDYGDSLSKFVRESVKLRMHAEDALEHEGRSMPESADAREAMLREIAFAGVDAVVAEDEQEADAD